ncbi:MAG: hypothetical protein M3Y86_08155 [Verrucomicrobiota bacterium]|nr:hypothetical protein [Verrucomicrobiota bacterium]
MKKLVTFATRVRTVTAPVGCLIAVILAVGFWFSTGATQAQTQCVLCHKKTLTLTLECGSLAYRGHLGHGDTMGPCAVTPADNP